MLPVGQGLHDDAPNTSEYVFSSHSSGTLMLLFEVKVPGEQGMHEELPGTKEYDPIDTRDGRIKGQVVSKRYI